MHVNEKIALTAAALVLSLGVAVPAQAASTMCAGDMMAKGDAMSGDAMTKDTAMAGDSMKKDDAMSGDAMAKDTAMAGDSMKKDDAMGGDAMAKDTAMAGDKMKDGMMMADYTVKPGESLWTIAADTLCDGNRYHEIVDANADMFAGGMMIHPGEVLHIPGD